MAEITFADVLTDQRVSEVLNGEYIRLAKDRNGLPQHPALLYWRDFAGMGSLTTKIPYIGIDGYDLPTLMAEGAMVGDSTITDSNVTLSIARYSKAYNPTDVVKFTDSLGVFNPAAFAADAVKSHALRLVDVVANVIDGFNATTGTTTVNFSIAQFAATIAALEVNSHAAVPIGSVMSIMHPDQSGDLRADLIANAGGALQYQVSPDRLRIMGAGYQGQFLGVDMFTSDYVTTANAGADRAGAMFLPGSVLWGDMSQFADAADSVVIGGKVLFERVRNARGASTAYVSHSYLGAVLGVDSSSLSHRLGVTMISDAN